MNSRESAVGFLARLRFAVAKAVEELDFVLEVAVEFECSEPWRFEEKLVEGFVDTPTN